MQSARSVIVVVLLIVVALSGGYFVGQQNAASRNDVQRAKRSTQLPRPKAAVVAQGRLEPATGVINIGAAPGDQVESLNEKCREDLRVEAGQELLVLKGHKIRQAELALAESKETEAKRRMDAQRRLSEAQRVVAENGLAEAELKQRDIASKAKSIELLEKSVALAKTDLSRLKRLQKDPKTADVVSGQDVDRQDLALRKAENDLRSARAELELAKEAHKLALKAAGDNLKLADESASAAEAGMPIDSLSDEINLRRLQFESTRVTAPKSGRILRVLADEGSPVTNLPLVQIADVSRMVCIAEVYESNLKDVRVGMRAQMQSPALGEQVLKGAVKHVSKVIGQPSLPQPSPLARADRRTAEVRIELDPDSAEIAANYVFLQVNIRILPDGDEPVAADDQKLGDHADATGA